MSDDQGEQLAALELLSVAEALTEHARATLESRYHQWEKRTGYRVVLHLDGHQGRSHAYTAGWRAALEWYIGLGREEQLRDAIEEAYQQGRAEVHHERREQ